MARTGKFAKLLCALCVITLFLGPQAGLACGTLSITFIADTPKKEARLRKRYERAQEERKNAEQRAFRADIRSGRIESATQLAATLIPNVREWWRDGSHCGLGGDGDGPAMPTGALVQHWLLGTEFEGVTDADLKQFTRRRDEIQFNRDCSAEFRAAFAARLAAAFPRRKLIRDCIDLCKGFSIAHFTDPARQQRPAWEGDVWSGRLVRFHPELQQEVETFWNDRESDLQHLARLCPQALQSTDPARQIFLESVRRDKPSARFLIKRATKNRANVRPR